MATEELLDACDKKAVVTAEAAEECCEEAIGGAKEFLRRTGENFMDALRRITAAQPNESSFAISEKLLEEMWTTGWTGDPESARELGFEVVGFVQNPGFQVGPVDLQTGRVVVQEFQSGSPYAPGARAARGAGIAAGLLLATSILGHIRKARRTTRGKQEGLCCGCILSKLLSQSKSLSSTAPKARRRRVPIG